jgi:hypothetical protein
MAAILSKQTKPANDGVDTRPLQAYFTNHSIQNITRYTARGARLVQAHLARLSEGGPRAGTRPPFPADEPCRKPRCLEIADLGRLSFLPRQCSSASRFTAGAAFSSTKIELSGR